MKKPMFCVIALIFVMTVILGCVSNGNATTNKSRPQNTPEWVQNPEGAYPSENWVAVTGQASGRGEAEDAALNALSRAFKTNIAALTKTNQQLSQIVNDTAGKKSVSFNEAKNFFTQTETSTSVKALIGVETETFQAADGTWYANARMNRRECAARYAAMVRENESVINGLLKRAAALENRSGFDSYAALYYAASIAQATDNFQNILEVLDHTSVGRRPGYGGAAAIKTRMLALAGRITVGIIVDTGNRQEAVIIRRALGAFFTGMGFKVNEQAAGDYTLKANVTFEKVDTTQVLTWRYFFDAALETRGGKALFSYTGQGRAAHLAALEARRLALRGIESSVKEGDFAGKFENWLGSLLE